MRKSPVFVLLAGLVVLSTLPVWAADAHPRMFVVLVGIQDYADNQIPSRRHAEADASALYDLFTHGDHVEPKATQVKLLLGGKDAKRPNQPATRDNLLQSLRWLVREARPEDRALFFFIGQGGIASDRVCLFGSDTVLKDRGQTGITAADIERELANLKSQRVCALVDVNLRGSDAGKGTVLRADALDLGRAFLGTGDKLAQTPPAGRLLILANEGTRPPLDLDKHGLFAEVLLEGLKGAADRDGYEADGVVSIEELVRYVHQRLPELARKHGRSREEKEQRPLVLGAGGTGYVLTRNPAVTEKVKQRLDRFDRLTQDKKLATEVIDEGRTFLGRMPPLRAQQDLRRQYQKLADGDLTVDEFQKSRERIRAQMKLKRSDAVAFASRVMAAVNLMRTQHLKEPQAGDLVSQAIRGLYKHLDEKVPTELLERLDRSRKMDESQLLALLADCRERLGQREDLARDHDIEFALHPMMRSLDPYTDYITPETVARFRERMAGSYTGIGIKVGRDAVRDMLVVITPIKGSPAYKAGIQTGDIITKVVRPVDGKGKKLDPPEELSTQGLSVSDAVAKILGPVDTEVRLTVERQGRDKPLEFTMVRQSVATETVVGVRLKDNDDWDHVLDPANRVGYIRLKEFSQSSFADMRKALADMNADGGIKGLVLDMRFNPGGLLPSAVDISDLFIDDGLIVSIRDRLGRNVAYSGEHDGSLLNFPMVCLINGGSASGSEIVAACLQDHHRAVIIGERSFGKGTVQHIVPFKPTGGEIKLTTASFWRPSGKNLNRLSTKGTEDEEWGVVPDRGFVVKLSRQEEAELEDYQERVEIIPRRDRPVKEAAPSFEDRQLDKALEYLRGQIKTAAVVQPRKAG